MRRQSYAALALLPALALGMPGCAHHNGPAGAASKASDLDKMRAFAKCMRQHGVDMADPQTNGKGQVFIKVSAAPGTAGKGVPQKEQAAEAACRHLQPNGGKPVKLDPSQLAKMRNFAKCMREHGIDMPDPDPYGRVTMRAVKGKNDQGRTVFGPDDPKFNAAQKACQKYQPGIPGGGKGGFGEQRRSGN